MDRSKVLRRQTIRQRYFTEDYRNAFSTQQAVMAMMDLGMGIDEAHQLIRHWDTHGSILSSVGPRTLAEWKLYERAKKLQDGNFSYRDAVGILARDAGIAPKRVREVIGTSEEWRLGYYDDGLQPLDDAIEEKGRQARKAMDAMEITPVSSGIVKIKGSFLQWRGIERITSGTPIKHDGFYAVEWDNYDIVGVQDWDPEYDEMLCDHLDPDSLWLMANLRKNKTGLPVNLWLDEGKSYKRGKHGYRIKFQKDKGDHVSPSNLAVMTISDNPQVFDDDHELSNSELKEVSDFVIRNKEALKKLSDTEIEYDDFIKLMR